MYVNVLFQWCVAFLLRESEEIVTLYLYVKFEYLCHPGPNVWQWCGFTLFVALHNQTRSSAE